MIGLQSRAHYMGGKKRIVSSGIFDNFDHSMGQIRSKFGLYQMRYVPGPGNQKKIAHHSYRPAWAGLYVSWRVERLRELLKLLLVYYLLCSRLCSAPLSQDFAQHDLQCTIIVIWFLVDSTVR